MDARGGYCDRIVCCAVFRAVKVVLEAMPEGSGSWHQVGPVAGGCDASNGTSNCLDVFPALRLVQQEIKMREARFWTPGDAQDSKDQPETCWTARDKKRMALIMSSPGPPSIQSFAKSPAVGVRDTAPCTVLGQYRQENPSLGTPPTAAGYVFPSCA